MKNTDFPELKILKLHPYNSIVFPEHCPFSTDGQRTHQTRFTALVICSKYIFKWGCIFLHRCHSEVILFCMETWRWNLRVSTLYFWLPVWLCICAQARFPVIYASKIHQWRSKHYKSAGKSGVVNISSGLFLDQCFQRPSEGPISWFIQTQNSGHVAGDVRLFPGCFNCPGQSRLWRLETAGWASG